MCNTEPCVRNLKAIQRYLTFVRYDINAEFIYYAVCKYRKKLSLLATFGLLLNEIALKNIFFGPENR